MKKPTARCAIGEILITTGAGGAEGDRELTPPSSHCRAVTRRVAARREPEFDVLTSAKATVNCYANPGIARSNWVAR